MLHPNEEVEVISWTGSTISSGGAWFILDTTTHCEAEDRYCLVVELRLPTDDDDAEAFRIFEWHQDLACWVGVGFDGELVCTSQLTRVRGRRGLVSILGTL